MMFNPAARRRWHEPVTQFSPPRWVMWLVGLVGLVGFIGFVGFVGLVGLLPCLHFIVHTPILTVRGIVYGVKRIVFNSRNNIFFHSPCKAVQGITLFNPMRRHSEVKASGNNYFILLAQGRVQVSPKLNLTLMAFIAFMVFSMLGVVGLLGYLSWLGWLGLLFRYFMKPEHSFAVFSACP